MNKYSAELRKMNDPQQIRTLLIHIRSSSQAGEKEARDYCIAAGGLGCPLDLERAVEWVIQGNKSEAAFCLINSSNPDEVGRGIVILDQMARSGDAEAIKYFKVLHVSGCPTDLAGAVNWHIQLTARHSAAKSVIKPAPSGGCMVVVGILLPFAVLACFAIKALC